MGEFIIMGVGNLGAKWLTTVSELQYDNCSYLVINYDDDSTCHSDHQNITISEDELGNLDINSLIEVRDKIIDCKCIIILNGLDSTMDMKITYEILKIADKMNKFKKMIVTYPCSFEEYQETKIRKKYEKKIFNLIDGCLHTIYLNGFKDYVDSDAYIKDHPDTVNSTFVGIYESLIKQNEMLLNMTQIINCDIKRKIVIKILSEYNYYQKYIPLENAVYMEAFIGYIYSYLINNHEECSSYYHILATQLGGNIYYYENVNETISDTLCKLADTFKYIKNMDTRREKITNMKTLEWSNTYKFNKENYKNLLKEDIFNKAGIYLWVYKNTEKGYFVHYIGQTKREFKQRLREHFKAAFDGSCYIYDMERNENLTSEILRIAHKGEFENEDLEKKYKSLSDVGEKYISDLEFLFAPLDIEYIDDAESYLINKVVENKKESYKYFLINEVVPKDYNTEFKNIFPENMVVNF